MEQHVPRTIRRSEDHHQGWHMHEILKHASDEGLGAGLLEVRMVCGFHQTKHLTTQHCVLQLLQVRVWQAQKQDTVT